MIQFCPHNQCLTFAANRILRGDGSPDTTPKSLLLYTRCGITDRNDNTSAAGIIPTDALFRQIEQLWVFCNTSASVPLTASLICSTGNATCFACRIVEAEIATRTALVIVTTRRTRNIVGPMWVEFWITCNAMHTIVHATEGPRVDSAQDIFPRNGKVSA